MGLGYLARVVGRVLLARPPKGHGPDLPAKPAGSSRSPIAEADQRLHVEDFSAQFGSSVCNPAGSPSDGLEPSSLSVSADSGQLPSQTTPSADASDMLNSSKRLPRQFRVAEAPIDGQRVAYQEREFAPSPRPDIPATPEKLTKVKPAFKTGFDSRPGNARPDRSAFVSVEPAGKLSTEAQTPSSEAIGREETETIRPRIGKSAARPATADPTDELTRRLAKLDRWLEGASEPEPSTQESKPASEVRAVPNVVATPKPPGRPHAPEPSPQASIEPQPKLEIGSIEVEVITPRQSPVRRQPSPPQRSGNVVSSSFSTRPFGWRQR